MINYLLDTNILLRSRDISSPEFPLVDKTIKYLISNNHQCFITSQVIIEFWVVATRPTNVNGLGWNIAQTTQAIEMLINQFEILPETPDVFPTWLNLVKTYNISGKRTHDMRILAVMLTHNISHILTLNPKDFIVIPGINIIHPQDINNY